MPGLLALVSASLSNDEIRNPAAFPEYPPWEATDKVRITHTHTRHVTTLNKQDKTQVHRQSDAPEHTLRPLVTGVWYTDLKKKLALICQAEERKIKQIK